MSVRGISPIPGRALSATSELPQMQDELEVKEADPHFKKHHICSPLNSRVFSLNLTGYIFDFCSSEGVMSQPEHYVHPPFSPDPGDRPPLDL